MFIKRLSGRSTSVGAGSMADIAFLLLIFFLVATDIPKDQGIPMKLPIYKNEDLIEPPHTYSGTVSLKILVNANNELYMNEKEMKIENLKENIMGFVLNNDKNPLLPISPKKANIFLQYDRATSYQTYVQIYSKINGAYDQIRDDIALDNFNLPFDKIPESAQKKIIELIPKQVSEKEPTRFER